MLSSGLIGFILHFTPNTFKTEIFSSFIIHLMRNMYLKITYFNPRTEWLGLHWFPIGLCLCLNPLNTVLSLVYLGGSGMKTVSRLEAKLGHELVNQEALLSWFDRSSDDNIDHDQVSLKCTDCLCLSIYLENEKKFIPDSQKKLWSWKKSFSHNYQFFIWCANWNKTKRSIDAIFYCPILRIPDDLMT